MILSRPYFLPISIFIFLGMINPDTLYAKRNSKESWFDLPFFVDEEESFGPMGAMGPIGTTWPGELLGATGPTGATGPAGLGILKSNTLTNCATHNIIRVPSLSKESHGLLSQRGGGMQVAAVLDEGHFLAQAKSNRSPLPYGSTTAMAREKEKNDLWVDWLANQIVVPPQGGAFQTTFTAAGVVVGYDRYFSSGMVTGALAYNYSWVKEAHDAGKGHTNYVTGIFHGTAYLPSSFFLSYGLVGSLNLNHFDRNITVTSPRVVAVSDFTSYALDPSVRVGWDWTYDGWLVLEPFISADFVFAFQEAYTEKGAPGFNQHESAVNSGLFRLEPVLSIYEHWTYDWGRMILKERISYIRRQPMFGDSNTITVVDSGSSFIVGTNLEEANLFAFGAQFFIRANRGMFLSLTTKENGEEDSC